MKCPYACHSSDHDPGPGDRFSAVLPPERPRWPAAWAAFSRPRPASPIRSKPSHKRILNIFMHGGVSQLESWDPKPNTDTGGPFRAIRDLRAGHADLRAVAVHRQADAPPGDRPQPEHQERRPRQGPDRNARPAATGCRRPDYPHLGAVAAKTLTPAGPFPLPGHILIRGGGGGAAAGGLSRPQVRQRRDGRRQAAANTPSGPAR